MFRFSHVTRALDSGVHATHSSMVVGHNLHDILHGHLTLEAVFAIWVLVRLAIELARMIGKGWRRLRAHRCKEAGEATKKASTAQPPTAG